MTLTPRLIHNHRADAQDAPFLPGDLDAAAASPARTVTARDLERALCCADAVKLHVGVETDFPPAQKVHPALIVRDLAALVHRLAEAGVEAADDELAGYCRVYVSDPFGNRLELVEPLESIRPGGRS